MKSLLFITWDSDSSNYLENLFFPILKGIQEEGNIRCHVMQFSWAGAREVKRIARLAGQMDIVYSHYPIKQKPIAAMGAIWTVYRGISRIRSYIQQHNIHCLMPRSTMPAMMVNRLHKWLKERGIQVVFDADGLPIEERVDYAGLKPESLQYKRLKKEEKWMLERADCVLTRSKKAVDFHTKNIGEVHRIKFFTVSNGRDPDFFKPDKEKREKIRNEFGLKKEEKLWVYTGTLGAPYMLEEMLALFGYYHGQHEGSRFLILTRNQDDLENKIPSNLRHAVMLRTVDFAAIPSYLAAADVALSLRKPAPSLIGIAPVKIGEYLMMGLPVIVSSGVGDSREGLEGKGFCYLYDGTDPERYRNVSCWINGLQKESWEAIRFFAKAHYSLEKSIAGYLEALKSLKT